MIRPISDEVLRSDYIEVAPGVYEHRVWVAIKNTTDQREQWAAELAGANLAEDHDREALAALGFA
jgi:hypothetical protein